MPLRDNTHLWDLLGVQHEGFCPVMIEITAAVWSTCSKIYPCLRLSSVSFWGAFIQRLATMMKIIAAFFHQVSLNWPAKGSTSAALHPNPSTNTAEKCGPGSTQDCGSHRGLAEDSLLFFVFFFFFFFTILNWQFARTSLKPPPKKRVKTVDLNACRKANNNKGNVQMSELSF